MYPYCSLRSRSTPIIIGMDTHQILRPKGTTLLVYVSPHFFALTVIHSYLPPWDVFTLSTLLSFPAPELLPSCVLVNLLSFVPFGTLSSSRVLVPSSAMFNMPRETVPSGGGGGGLAGIFLKQ